MTIVMFSCHNVSAIGGPIVDTNMSFTLLSSRTIESDILFTLSFNVSFGPPSMIRYVRGSNTELQCQEELEYHNYHAR